MRILDIKCQSEIIEELKKVRADETGIEIMSKRAIQKLVKSENIPAGLALEIKKLMLCAGGEAAVSGEVFEKKTGITDIILMGNEENYKNFLKEAKKSSTLEASKFAENVLKELESYKTSDFSMNAGKFILELGKRVHVMGILNITSDSFSDGGKYFRQADALKHAYQMAEEGADIIDVGAESTRPGAKPVDLDEELKRVIPTINELSKNLKVPISIDTYKPEVAKEAIRAGAILINDIFGLRKQGMMELAAGVDVPVVIMHMKGMPGNMQKNPVYKEIIGEIYGFFERQIEAALRKGIKKEKIILDPGIGFGKTKEHNLEILRRLSEFKSLGFPILIGVSRKSFIGLTLNIPVDERLEGTIASTVISIINGARIVRVHDVKENVRAIRMTEAILKSTNC